MISDACADRVWVRVMPVELFMAERVPYQVPGYQGGGPAKSLCLQED